MKIILQRIRNKTDSEIQEEVDMLKIQIDTESDTEPFINKIRKLNKKNVFVLFVVYVLLGNLAGIGIISSYLLEIFSDIQVQGSFLVISYGVSELIFSFFFLFIADKFGRWARKSILCIE